jgi:hypothetical protein
MIKRSVLALAFVGMQSAGVAQAQQASLVFTAIPDEDETRLVGHRRSPLGSGSE